MLRIIIDGYRDPLLNMAIDEAIYLNRENVEYDTLRIYMWRPSGVSIGRSQEPSSTINLECIERFGFKAVRRATGGGALLHMEGGEITYSVVFGRDSKYYSLDIKESAMEIAKGLIYALEYLGIKSSLSGEYISKGEPLCYFRRGTSDILIDGKKISGSAQVRNSKALLQHGTLLIEIDPDKWECVIKDVDKEKFVDSVTSISKYLENYSIEDVINKVIRGFLDNFKCNHFYGSLTSREIYIAEDIYREKLVEYVGWRNNINM